MVENLESARGDADTRPAGQPEPGNEMPASNPPVADGGWMGRLANKSSGVPGFSGPGERGAKPDATDRALWRLFGLGTELVGGVVVFGLIGAGLDAYFHWGHAATITLIVVAFLGGMYLLIKAALNADKNADKPDTSGKIDQR